MRFGRVLVLGIGASGRAAARFCVQRIGSGVDSVAVVDSGSGPERERAAEELRSLGVEVALDVTEVTGEFDLAIASPGIPPHAPLMVGARRCAREVISEIEFAYRNSCSPWIAVTGTNGKTTTTALIAHLLETGGFGARAVGNIGTPAIEVVDDADCVEVLVAEVSSFQLALTSTFHPRVAVLLNVTPDHVDWHGSLEAYAADKGKVFSNLTDEDTAVIDVDDPGSARFAEPVMADGVAVVRVSRERAYAHGATVAAGHLTLETQAGPIRLIEPDRLRIRGPHNVSNALAAAAAVHAIGVAAADIAEGLATFEPIEHRLEPAGESCGVEWFNDSKATNPDATLKAIDSFDGRSMVLLLGGRNKGNDFTELAREAMGRVRAVVAFGEARDEFVRAFAGTGVLVAEAATLSDAIGEAKRLAEPGDAVVLSPACASFDEFANYEQRGRAFKAAVASMGTS